MGPSHAGASTVVRPPTPKVRRGIGRDKQVNGIKRHLLAISADAL
ncbi:hypothetical protein [Streptomyces sp. NPDC017991]